MIDERSLITPHLARLRHKTIELPNDITDELPVTVITAGAIRVKTVDVGEVHVFDSHDAPVPEILEYGLSIGKTYMGPSVDLTEVWIPAKRASQLPVELLVRGPAQRTKVQLVGGIDSPVHVGNLNVFGCELSGRYVAFGTGDMQISTVFHYPERGSNRHGSMMLDHVQTSGDFASIRLNHGARLALSFDTPPAELNIACERDYFRSDQVRISRVDDAAIARVCSPFSYSIYAVGELIPPKVLEASPGMTNSLSIV
jgi:hypothetical protein